jgi:hypothetical protein
MRYPSTPALVLFAAILISTIYPIEQSIAQGAGSRDPTNVPLEFREDVETAIIRGRNLYNAYNAFDGGYNELHALSIYIAKTAVHDYCDVDYVAIPVWPEGFSFHLTYVYLIGEPRSTGDIILGRHYRVNVDNYRHRVWSVSPSTMKCEIGRKDEFASAILASGELSPTPTEFHVFVSLKAQLPLTVKSNDGAIWKVDGDSIYLVKPR